MPLTIQDRTSGLGKTMANRASRYSSFALLGILALSLVGCSRGDVPETGTVTGVLTLDGEPVEGAFITFSPKEGGRASRASSNANGEYTLEYTDDIDGAKIGMHVVEIFTGRTAIVDDKGKVTQPAVKEKLPKEYTDRSLEREVKAGKNVINFEAKSS
jgi:hypothetical protein